MKKFYAIILGFTAVSLAATAAFFSVYGLSKLYMGAALAVIIFTGILEFAKMVTVSYLHQFWGKIEAARKVYLVFAIVILMVITSMGVYGFLTNAYTRASTELDKISGNIELLDKKISIKKEEKIRLNEQIKTKNDRVISLTNLRKGQETRLDSLYQKGWMSAAKKTETVISQADNNIATLNKEIDDIGKKIENLNDSISKYETTKLEANNSDVAADVGPLKYIARLTGRSMDSIVNFLTLLLIVVFDPLAVALVIATSSMIKLIKEEKTNKAIKDREDIFKKKMEYVSDEQGNFQPKNKEIIPKKTLWEKMPKKWKGLFKKEPKTAIESPVLDTKEVESVATIQENIESTDVKETAIESAIEDTEQPKVEKVDDSVKEEVESQPIEEVSQKKDSVFNINQDTIIQNIFTATTAHDIVTEVAPQLVEIPTETTEPALSETETSAPAKDVFADNVSKEIIVENVSKKQSLYLQLLEIFYDKGNKKSGDVIPTYKELKKMIDSRLPNVNEKDIKDFLLICNLFKITEFKESSGYFEKQYQDARILVSKI